MICMMLKQIPSRNSRSTGRGHKVKHVTQLCLMLALTFWMLYLLNRCYIKKAALHKTVGSEKVVAKLGRKGLLPGAVVEVEVEEDEESKGAEEGRGDEFEQADDLLEEIDEQEMDDKELENQSEDALTERISRKNETVIMRD